jgi:hypothetical protein
MSITDKLIHYINNEIPIVFSKYGDGEYICASKDYNLYGPKSSSNCDNDTYTNKLSEGIIESFKYFANIGDEYYFGKWENDKITQYWENLVNNKLNWANYLSLLLYDHDRHKINIYKEIKNSKLKKIIICNPLLIKSKILLNIDYMINVPLNNWFDKEFNKIIYNLKKKINKDDKFILMTCCGMGAKVIIAVMHKIYPNGIYLDIGSGLDTICTKRSTRGADFNYEISYDLFKEIIPDNWDDPQYNYIYEEAHNKLGLHIPK